MKKERPILFSAPMIQAIMGGRKTQTRRIVKGYAGDKPPRTTNVPFEDPHGRELKCPYGEPGDVLWVRETWRPKYVNGGLDGFRKQYPDECPWHYRADRPGDALRYRPSIHMPKDAARIWLEIVSVRVDRLNEITSEDAMSEGIQEFTKDGTLMKYGLNGWNWAMHQKFPHMTHAPSTAFMHLWWLINGEQSWNENPWVWVVEFRKIDRP